MDKEIVTVGLNHICPMITGVTPHVGGLVTGPGCPGVLINGQPVSVMGDICVCCGPPDTVAQGYPGVMINGVPIVVKDCMTAHGGTIPMGVPGVTIGSAMQIEPMTMHIQRIPFPQIRLIDKIGAAVSGNSKKLKQAADNQNDLRKKASQEEPAIYNVRWEKEEVRMYERCIKHKITVVADTVGFDDGETVTFTVSPEYVDPGCGKQPQDMELQGTVKDGCVTAEWTVEI